ncbi:hypothetical protein [Chromohalobacter israelensis]|uniref:Uncharacterized protein n=1 Tax=Chromohalobacter israelensis (strain ATCC BAA-138 / DSM 3043 / CIP 106854 / NCIMB 13768 / 1H11) TaxID=290398 RepID=Q1QVL2_CHRI1|nr:hypothetical protein [Chromohalobacter salexigens]ABE59496.1 conserved hypothetical protein [Chromohalobacter salexigens DSM 3043]
MLLPLPFQRKSSTTQETSQVRLEREGRNEIRRITAAVDKVPWSVSLMQILWTAGPVTLLGAWGGYLLGYGKAPTMENYVFFISYTVITGAAGILANLGYHLTRGRKAEKISGQIEQVIKALPELLLVTRDLIVDNLEGDARRREAAAMLLRKHDLSPEGVELAAIELLDDRESARLIGQIDVYRRVGLHARIRDLVAQYRDILEPQFNALYEAAPIATHLLRERFEGRAPDLHQGVPRDENFIERVMAAIEQDNDLLMTLQDVEEMLILAFELISGREIPVLSFEYRGRWRLAQAFDNLEEARARQRIAQATGLSRLKALNVYLAEQSGTLVEDAASGLRAELLLERSVKAMDALAEQIVHLAQAVEAGQEERKRALRTKSDILANAIQLYKSVSSAYEQVGRSHAQLLKSVDRWERITASLSDDTTRLRLGPGRRGLRIRERTIALDDEAKARVCKHLARYLTQAGITSRHRDTRLSVGVDAAKRLAIEIFIALEPHVGLSQPATQRAINSSNAADFGQIEPNLSAAAKAALGASMVREVDTELSRAAESLALALVRHYRVELEPAAIEFLKRQYGARDSTLKMLSNINLSGRGDSRNVSFLSHRPPAVGSPHRDWYRALVRARRLFGRR